VTSKEGSGTWLPTLRRTKLKIDSSYFKLSNISGFQHEESEKGHTVTFMTSTVMGNPSVVSLIYCEGDYRKKLKNFKVSMHEMRGAGTRVTLKWNK